MSFLDADITVGFNPATYMFADEDASQFLTLVVSDLAPGVLECDVDVEIAYNDGPKASKFHMLSDSPDYNSFFTTVVNVDYAPISLIFTLGTTTMDGDTIPVPVDIFGDDIVEGPHSFTVDVVASDLVMSGQSATVTISDGESEWT